MRKIFLLFVLLFGIVGVGIAQQRDILDREEIRTVSQSVVYIEALDGRGNPFASGSGTIIEPTGLIYTNHHVIEGADDLAIYLVEDMRELPVHRYYASIVRDFNEIDFAILQIDRDERGRDINLQSLDLPFIGVNQMEVSHGDQIHIFGFPDIGDGYLVLTEGTITTIENGNIGGNRLPIWYRTDATMSSGNSGGLVVDSDGRYIGIPTWVRKADTTQTQLGGILPITAIEAVLKTGSGGANTVVTDKATITLQNDSSHTICYVYISPTTSTEWGEDFLGSQDVMRPGDKSSWEVAAGTYDLLLRDCERENLAEKYSVRIERSVGLRYPSDLSGEDTPTIPNDGELFIEITDVDYEAVDPSGDTDEYGMKIYTYIRATGYRGIPLRVGVFFYWEDDDTPVSGENAHENNRTPSGNLTHQEVVEPLYDDTEWTEYWFWMPYSSFPDGRGERDAYISASVDVDGSSELGNTSDPWEFTLFYED